MAYDQTSAYEAPRRAYSGQAQHEAPAQAAYGGHHSGQGYNEQQYDGRAGYEQVASPYNDGYPQGYQGQPGRQPVNGNAQPPRNYDPRFQQRPMQQQQQQQPPRPNGANYPVDRSRDPRYPLQQMRLAAESYGQHPGERAHQYQQPPGQRQQEGQDYQQRPVDQQRIGQPQPAPPRGQGNGPAVPKAAAAAAVLPLPPPPPAPQPQETKKMTMEEWKAKEKAKMQKAAMSPEGFAQDTAFPVFPNKAKERLKAGHRKQGQGVTSGRSSEEQTRSSTSSDRPSVKPPSPEEKANIPREAPPQQNGKFGPQSRPSMDHKPYSFEPIPQRPGDGQYPPQQQHQQHKGSPYDMQSSTQRPALQHNGRPVGAPQQQQLPIRDQRVPTARQSPPRANGHRQNYPAPLASQYNPDYYASPQEAQQQLGAGARPPTEPNDTRNVRAEASAYLDHKPPSPAQAPRRQSPGQGARASPIQQRSSPLSQYSHSQTPNGYGEDQAAPPAHPVYQGPQHQRQEIASSIYDDYAHGPPAAPAASAPQTRDEEIEAEMPDFDSAAPQQTSMLHKRNDTVEEEVAAPVQHPNHSVQPFTHPKTRVYQQHADPYQAMAQQKQVSTAPVARGFDFGWDEQQSPTQYQDDDPYQQPPQEEQNMTYRQRAPPVQPPFASELPVRRSADDAREMPSHPQAPQQSQPARGPYPPHMRPEFDRFGSVQTVQTVWSEPPAQLGGHPYMQSRPNAARNFSGQTVHTVRSEPGQGMAGGSREIGSRHPNVAENWAGAPQPRVPSAPPIQQGLQQPPGRPPIGAPLTQQRSAPESQPYRHSNPDSLPHHPTPVRPGLTEAGMGGQPAKPPPVRNYSGSSQPANPHQRPASVDPKSPPVTHAELDQLRAAVSANPNNNKQALLLAKKLVEASNVLASEGGRADPKTTAKNREKYILDAHKRIKKLASAGYPDAQFYLADCYGQGSLGLQVDTKEAFSLYQAAAKQSHAQAAYRTAVCCEMGPDEGGGTRKDYNKAVQWYRRAAALGDVAAMFKLGMVLLKGLLAQPRNVSESLAFLHRAADRADRDHPHALHELAVLHEPATTDPDVRAKLPADEPHARDLFLHAAGLGYKLSQFRLGQAYEYGSLGLPIDNRASISYYSKAAAQGEHQAELALSGWYLTGAEGILPHSDTEAFLWARKAAQAEPPLAKAMFAMGYFAEMGIGCAASLEEARRWYGRAAVYKFPKALERLEELKKTGKARPAPANGKLTRKDQKRDEAECVVM